MIRVGAYYPLFALFLAATNLAAQSSQISANELVRKTFDNELAAGQNPAHWTYLSRKQESGKTMLRQVVETKQILLERLIAIDNTPLSPEARAKEDRRITQLVNDPAAVEKLQKEQTEDKIKERKLMGLFPRAFLYQYAGREGDVVRLTFKPNPAFTPPNREARVFHAMAGELWVHEPQQRLVKISGHLIEDVNFGWGILGHLDKGGRFEVLQTEVSPHIWEATSLHVDMRGRALLFASINNQEHETMSQFDRIPDELPLARAVELLMRNDHLARKN